MALSSFLREVSAHPLDKPISAIVHIDTSDVNLRWVVVRMVCAAMKRDACVSYNRTGMSALYDAGEVGDLGLDAVAAWRGVNGVRTNDPQTLHQTRISVKSHRPLTLCVTSSELADHAFSKAFWEHHLS